MSERHYFGGARGLQEQHDIGMRVSEIQEALAQDLSPMQSDAFIQVNKDGPLFPVKCCQLRIGPERQVVFCAWISRDPNPTPRSA